MKLYERLFLYLTNTWYILFALASLKLWNFAEIYLDRITYYYNLLIALVLMFYFNPFVKTKITPVHRKMVFSAAFFVFISIGFGSLIEDLKENALAITKKKPEEDINTTSSQ